jgi:opacity protein-like surface antigen
MMPMLTPSTVLADSVPKNSIGIALFAGWEIPSGLGLNSYNESYDGRNTILIPSYGWFLGKRWHIDLEGNIGCYHFKRKKTHRSADVFALGLAVVAAYDFLQFDRWAAYADIGVGVSYWSDTPRAHLVDRNRIPGMLQFGAGTRIPIGENRFVKLAYRLAHTSGIFSDDNGINNHGLLVGVTKTF